MAESIARLLKTDLTPVEICKFADHEIHIHIERSIRDKDVYIIESTNNPGHEYLMELLILIDAAKRASAARITCVMPFFGYARQDRKSRSREAITAKLVANMLTTAGANRIISADLHADQIQGFFDIPLDHIRGLPIIAEHFKQQNIRDLVVVSPDQGGIKINREMANRLGAPLVIMEKSRSKKKHNTLDDMMILGEVKGKNIVMIDDEINTAGTMARACTMLRKAGAKDIRVSCTHAVFAGPAVERLDACKLKEIVVLDTISQEGRKQPKNLTVLSIAPVLATIIDIINTSKPMGIYLDKL
ncbi:MAG: ribose-phosphate diphosphokinase [DPANN group archaeon]|nr:ribose-phosphate diphosphokinase [DPANN group archaeon]